jgi:hypothetical protein
MLEILFCFLQNMIEHKLRKNFLIFTYLVSELWTSKRIVQSLTLL